MGFQILLLLLALPYPWLGAPAKDDIAHRIAPRFLSRHARGKVVADARFDVEVRSC